VAYPLIPHPQAVIALCNENAGMTAAIGVIAISAIGIKRGDRRAGLRIEH
jgi:hypothetical protein